LPASQGKAVLAGGMGVFGTPSFYESTELYDPANNTFSSLSATLFAGETGWAIRSDNERVIDDQKMADGRYAFLATRVTNNQTDLAVAIYDPATARFTKLAFNPAWNEKSGIWTPVVNQAENAVYFISGNNSNSAANLTFTVHRVELSAGNRLTSQALTLSGYYPGGCAIALLPDKRLFVTGGAKRVDSRYNFEPVVNTFFISGLPSESTASAPQLKWKLAGSQLTLSWPAEATGYSLEYSTALGAAANWSSATNPVTVSGSNNQVTLSVAGKTGYFRLRKP
jgi:hypothetical protein